MKQTIFLFECIAYMAARLCISLSENSYKYGSVKPSELSSKVGRFVYKSNVNKTVSFTRHSDLLDILLNNHLTIKYVILL